MGTGIMVFVDGAPDEQLCQTAQIEVEEAMGRSTTYSLRFDVDAVDGDLPLLIDDRLSPGSMLQVVATLADEDVSLVRGPVHGQRIHLEHGVGASWVEVQGSDTTVVMDREARSAVWADVKDSDIVRSILGRYGYDADVEETKGMHLEDQHSLVQRESDLAFVRRLARRNGFLFWVTSDARGRETAHFGRPATEGEPGGAIVLNLDFPSTDVLEIEWDVERPTSVAGRQLELQSRAVLEANVTKSPLGTLGEHSLADITGDVRSMHLSAAVDDAGDLLARNEGALIEAQWFVRARCQTTVGDLQRVVRAHSVFELHGAGSRHSGGYLVDKVRHNIDANNHSMELELLRNGWRR